MPENGGRRPAARQIGHALGQTKSESIVVASAPEPVRRFLPIAHLCRSHLSICDCPGLNEVRSARQGFLASVSLEVDDFAPLRSTGLNTCEHVWRSLLKERKSDGPGLAVQSTESEAVASTRAAGGRSPCVASVRTVGSA